MTPTEQDQADAARAAYLLSQVYDMLEELTGPRLSPSLVNPGAAPVLLAAQGRVSAELAALEGRRAEWRREGERGGGRASVSPEEAARVREAERQARWDGEASGR